MPTFQSFCFAPQPFLLTFAFTLILNPERSFLIHDELVKSFRCKARKNCRWNFTRPSSMIGHDFTGKVQIAFRTSGIGVVKNDGFAKTWAFAQADISRDD